MQETMVAKMLGSMIGMAPEELAATARSFGAIAKYAFEALQRIEKKQDLILDHINEDRETNGRTRLEFPRTPDRPNGG